MIIFLHGEDLFLVSRRKRALQEAFLQKNPGDEMFVFDFEDDRSPENIHRALSACEGGLFAEKKMIVFLHALMFEDAGSDALVELLKSETLTNSPENIYLFVEPGKIKKTGSVTKVLLKKADQVEEIESFLIAKGSKKVADFRKLEVFARKELALLGGETSFGHGVLERLVQIVGADTARLVSEIAKLVSYKPKGQIEVEDISLLVGRVENEDIFRALDALVVGRKDEALRLFRSGMTTSDDVYGDLGMCAWQVRRLLVIREAYDSGLRQASDIARATALPPFMVEKALRSLREFPLERLKKGLMLLSDLDKEMKQGATSPELALDMFIWKF